MKRQSIESLTQLAHDYRIEGASTMRKPELIFALMSAGAGPKGELCADGVLELLPDGSGFLRAPDYHYRPGPDDIFVSQSQVKRFGLRTGDTVSGQLRPPKEGERYFALLKVDRINHGSPEARRDQTLFDNLTPIHPNRRLTLEHGANNLSTRVIDLLCPIGKGQRCLIVSPPRAGQTVLLQEIARAIEQNHPEAVLIVLLIDERPEEVVNMQRTVRGQVVGTTFDEPASRHVELAELVLEKAKRLAEQKKDVVILLDSITRLARAWATVVPASGKGSPGGVDANALHKPKRYFGAARNLEQGGSLTLIATLQVDTGSRKDEVIFEEFKGTGNSELHLDRKLVEQRIFPCIDLNKSGTRNEELLTPEAAMHRIWILRQLLHPLGASDAMVFLRDRLGSTDTNREFLDSMSS